MDALQCKIKIRERKKGAKPEEYDRMGTEFHRWFRDAVKGIGLEHSADFYRFIDPHPGEIDSRA